MCGRLYHSCELSVPVGEACDCVHTFVGKYCNE